MILRRQERKFNNVIKSILMMLSKNNYNIDKNNKNWYMPVWMFNIVYDTSRAGEEPKMHLGEPV